MRGISWVAEGLLASQEWLWTMAFVKQLVYKVFPAGSIFSSTCWNCSNLFIIWPCTTLQYIILWSYSSRSLCRHLHNAFTMCFYGCALSQCNYISRACSQCFATCQPIHDLFLVNSYTILHNLGVITFFLQFANIVLRVYIITKPYSIVPFYYFDAHYCSIIAIGPNINTIFLHKNAFLSYITSFPVSVGLYVVWFLQTSVRRFVVSW
jgi:hypothetical protein